MIASTSMRLFAVAALFFAGATADLCEEALRTKVVNGKVLADGSLQTKDGVVYPKDTYWKQDNFWWACPCLTGRCVRLCSKELINSIETSFNASFGERGRTVQIWDSGKEQTVQVNKQFKIVNNASCPGGQAYPLEPEYNEMDSHKLLLNGSLYFDHPNSSEEFRFVGAKEFCIITMTGEPQKTVFCSYLTAPPSDLKFKIFPAFFILSAIFLLLTLIAFFLTPDHNTLHGKSVVCQAGSLLIMFIGLTIIYLTGERTRLSICVTTTYITYYFLLASFFWLNVMCVDIYLTFRSFTPREDIKFRYISLYAWGVPGLFALLTIVLNITVEDDVFSPGIGKHRCWFQGFWSDLLYFNGPVLVLLSINTYLFGSTVYKLYQLKKETKRMLRSGDSRVHNPTGSHSQKDKDRLVLYIKLFLLMGGTWIMEIISWAVGGPDSIWYITDSINALRGLLIFWFCVWSNKSIRNSLRERFFPGGKQNPLEVALNYNSKSNGSISASTNSTTPSV